MSDWSKETYEASLSSRCWWGVSYGLGWDACDAIRSDKELQALVKLESDLAPIPNWARDIVEKTINYPPVCPHYLFPMPFLEIVSAIGRQQAQGFIHGCFTADRARKERALDYLFCLDAWLKNAAPEKVSRELGIRATAPVDWDQVCRDTWEVLGERTDLKALLIERTLHRYRWLVQSSVWDDSPSEVFCRDQYLGDLPWIEAEQRVDITRGAGDPWGAEFATPYVMTLEARLAQTCPNWEWFETAIHETWLCAPKCFRFLERLLWSIGQGRPTFSLRQHTVANEDDVPRFLQCEDTLPDAEWVGQLRQFHQALKSWVKNCPPTNDVEDDVYSRLGESSPIKSWLVRLFIKNLELMDRYREFLG